MPDDQRPDGTAKPEQTPVRVDLTAAEFQDYDGPSAMSTAGKYDFSRIWTQATLRAFAAMVVALLIISAPSTSPRLLAYGLAALLFAWAIGAAVELISGSERTFFSFGRIVVLIALSIALVVWDEFTATQLGRLIGIGLIAAGFITAWKAYQARADQKPTERSVAVLFYVGIGAALLISPATLLSAAILSISVYWFLAGLISVITNLRTGGDPVPPSETWHEFMRWVQIRPNTADDRIQLYDKLFYEGEAGPRRLSRFFALMAFATAIAAYGIIADSTAVVIGAMLVAPLMTPLMGTSLAMVMGWPRRVLYTGLVALAGIALAIGLSIVFGWSVAAEISSVTNSQVASRISPTMVDLLIAVAAGGAGAFALSRPDVSDSLPGVAVAIALVPPLAVIGLMISQADWSSAIGALLLFTTNLVAILLVGGFVFVMTGVVPLFQISSNTDRIKKTLGMVAILALLIVAVLGVSTDQIEAQSQGVAAVTAAVDDYIEDTELSRGDVTVTQSQVIVTLTGPEAPDDFNVLIDSITLELGEVEVLVHWFQRTTFRSDT